VIKFLEGKTQSIPEPYINKFPFKLKSKLKYEEGLLILEKDGHELVLVPEEFAIELVKKIHGDLCHVGIKKLLHYIENIFYWPKIQETIQECLQLCMQCAKRKTDQTRTKEILIPRLSSSPLEQIVIDIAYMDKVASKKYIVVIIDRFSKLVSLTATSSQDEKVIYRTLLNNWIYKFGKPQSILSDRGKNFESAYLKERLGALGIKQELTSPYQHQSNGLVERVIRTTRDWISASLAGKCEEKNWYEILPRIEFCLNATQQSATGYSPFEVIFGRKINLHSTLEQSVESRDEIKNRTQINSGRAAERMRNFESDKRGMRNFEVGEEVLVRIEPHKRNKNGNKYEGPFKILRFLSAHQVELQGQSSTKRRRIEWLKKWHGS
jgi:transposase InsO family protein